MSSLLAVTTNRDNRHIILLCLVILLAFGLRFYDCTYPPFKWMDETNHVPAAVNYWNNGQFEPDNWEHPPLRHTIEYGFLSLFGDTPYGWRMRNILFGAFAAGLTFLFARKTSGKTRVGLMAGILMATDPLHIVLSRYTYEEIYGGVFFLGSIVMYLYRNDRKLRLVLSALLMGCALATKWYYVPGWGLLCLLALLEHRHHRNERGLLFLGSIYLLVPISVFLLSYYQWFGRGYRLSELYEFLVNAYYALQGYRENTYDYGLFFLSHLSPWEWFVKQITMGQGVFLEDGRGEFILYMNMLPIWILTLPSVVAATVVALRKREYPALLPSMFFLVSYALFLVVRRPAFLYSAIPLLPFAFTAIAQTIAQAAERISKAAFILALLLMMSLNLYLYPLVTAKKVPISIYTPFLHSADIKSSGESRQ